MAATCTGVRHSGDNTGAGTGGGDIVGGGTGGPMQPHVQPSLRDGGTRNGLQVPTTQHPSGPSRILAHVPNIRTIPRPVMSLQPWDSHSGTAYEAYEVHVGMVLGCAVSSRVCRIRARNPRFPPTEVDARSSSCVVHVFEGSCTESCPCVNRDNDQCPGVCPTRSPTPGEPGTRATCERRRGFSLIPPFPRPEFLYT